MSAWLAAFLGAAVKSTVVLGAAWTLTLALRRQSAARRHLVWTAAASALLALPLLSISMPALRVGAGPFAPLVSSVTFRTTTAAQADGNAAPIAHTAQPQRFSHSAPWSPDLRYLIPFVWAAGTLLVMAHLAAAWVAMWRIRRNARPVAGSAQFQSLAQALAIRRRVALLEGPEGAMPLSFGVLRPAVLLPAGASEWSEDRRRVVLLHELAHIRRGDLATQIVARVAVALFWWNPLVWTAWREFVKERERAADDLVLAAGEPATGYATHLLDIARAMQHTPALVSAAVAMAHPSQLEGRLMAILDRRTNRQSARPGAALAAAALSIALVAPFAALQAQDKADARILPNLDQTIRNAIDLQILDNAASAYANARQYDGAKQLLDKSLTIREQASGDHGSAYAIGLMKLGDLSARRGKSDDALDFYSRAVALGDTPETAPALIYLAEHSFRMKDTGAANSFIERALAAADGGAVKGRALTVQGNFAKANGLIGVAELHYLQALAQDPSGSTEAAFTMETYAKLLNEQSRTAEAQAMQQQALLIRQAHVAALSPKIAAADGEIATVGGSVLAPTLASKQEPEYSEEARQAKYQGTVLLGIVIDTNGNATNLQLTKSLGFGLDEKAAEAVLQWKFKPGMRDGQPVPVHAVIEVNFRLL